MLKDLTFTCLPFADLQTDQLYEVLQLRSEVFVVEQNCAYQDLDGLDQQSHHLMVYDAEGKLQAYVRLLPVGLSYPDYAAIGRVVTSPAARGKGFGRPLMEVAIEWVNRLFESPPLKLSAQYYLLDFYHSLGFQEVGTQYLEDGIPHIAMVYGGLKPKV